MKKSQDFTSETAVSHVSARTTIVQPIFRARDARGLPPVTMHREGRGFTVTTAPGWLQKLPLTAAALEEARRQWQGLGRALYIRALSLRAPAG